MKAYGVIMAGGVGTRFWPLSRQRVPKQLLKLSGKDTMINETIARISHFIDKKDVFIVTNRLQSERIADITKKNIKRNHILVEPTSRNTAACIGYAAVEIIRKYGDGVMCVFPSDHFIKDNEAFAKTMKQAIEVAHKQDKLVTVGIRPSFPSAGYGYIKYDKSQKNTVKNVIKFVEKPDYETAKNYVQSGEYAWNSGMFVWKASTILKELKKYMPIAYEKLCVIADSMDTERELETISEVYPSMPNISIDYGIIEHSKDVLMLEGTFEWNDVGSWDSIEALYQKDDKGNINYGEHINIDTTNCVSHSTGRLIATIGVENLIIVETKDAVLVCSKDSAQDVKELVEMLKSQGKTEYL